MTATTTTITTTAAAAAAAAAELIENNPYLKRFQQIIDDSKLSVLSKAGYKTRLNRLVKITGHDLNWVMMNADKTMNILEENGIKELQTKKAYINAILTLFKHTEGLKNILAGSHARWLNHYRQVNSAAQVKYETCQASERQRNAYVKWDDILARRDQLDKSSPDYLILCMYTMIPPGRADMNEVRIFNDRLPSDEDEERFPNHLLIDHSTESITGFPTMTLIYNEFKTRSKRLQKYENELPLDLTSVVADSLKRKPRDFLIVSPKTGRPYHNPHSFTVYVDRMLFRIFNKPVTINTLRHSFINSINLNLLTPMDKKILSDKLMHSTSMFERYRFINAL